MIIGLTGPYASGKSLAAAVFKNNGWIVMDVDRVGHEVLEDKEVIENLSNTFGHDILNKTKKIDRKKLGDIVFKDKDALEKLNAIVHPEMKDRIIHKLDLLRKANVVIDAALLFEMGLNHLTYKNILIDAPVKTLITRALERRGTSREKTLRIMKSQMPIEKKRKIADVTVTNDGTVKEFNRKMDAIIKSL